jgi:energy-coupling factor transport system permease protein
MRGIEFFRNVSIGQYVHTGSYVHRLTPATKYLGLFALLIAVFANTTVPGTVAILLIVIGATMIAKVGPGFLLRGMIPAWPFLSILVVMTLVLQSRSDASATILSAGPLRIHVDTLYAIILLLARFAVVVAIVGLFTSVVSEQEVAHGAEDSLAPLKRFGFPAHELALMIVIALRFVPILAGELEDIVKAQASRGAAFGTRRGGPIAKARAYLPLFVPVTIRALERAELLTEAMEARSYTGEGSTRLVIYEKTRGEGFVRIGIALFACLGLIAGLLLK